jgi:hypothetical protein
VGWGSFDDELRKHMAGEANPRQVARSVSGALLGIVPDDIDVEYRKQQVTLRSRSFGKTLVIGCDRPDAYRLDEPIGFPAQVLVQPRSGRPPSAVTLREMESRVAAWVKAVEPRLYPAGM